MQTKLLTNRISYTFIRGGYYYFSRRVPADLQCHYRYPRVVQGLLDSADIIRDPDTGLAINGREQLMFLLSNEVIRELVTAKHTPSER